MNPIPAILVLARTLGLVATAPVLAAPGLEPRFRLLLAVALAALIAPVVGPSMAVQTDVSAIAVACLGEAVIGAALGWAAGLVIAGARQAGEVVGAQAGLSTAALFDPDAGDGHDADGAPVWAHRAGRVPGARWAADARAGRWSRATR